jgi:hypothetical protein
MDSKNPKRTAQKLLKTFKTFNSQILWKY